MVNFIAVAIAAAAIGVAGYFIFYKKKATASSASAPVQAIGWMLQYSPNMPAQMSKASDGYFIDLPTKNGLHYIVQQAPKLQLGQLVTMNFNVSGTGTIVPVQGTTAKVSLYLQRKGDNMSGVGAMQQYRYWHSAALLVNGDGSLAATVVTPDQWGDVMGKRGTDYPNQFAECVANAGVIGFTCGDPSAGAGHGVYVKDGTARFTLKSFVIQ